MPGLGALDTTAGPGIAFASSSSVLLISGQIPSGELGRGRGQLHETEDQLAALPTTPFRASQLAAQTRCGHSDVQCRASQRASGLSNTISPDEVLGQVWSGSCDIALDIPVVNLLLGDAQQLLKDVIVMLAEKGSRPHLQRAFR